MNIGLGYNCNMSIKYLTFYYPNGQKKSEGNYDEQEPIGDHTSWYESGNIKFESVELSESSQIYTNWYENGHMKSRGVRTEYFESGLWTYWYETGHKKAEGFWGDKDEREGKWNFWNDQGQLICSGIHSAWQGNGLWTFWDDDGFQIHEREYRDAELLHVWKNLRSEGCPEERIDIYKALIFDVEN